MSRNADSWAAMLWSIPWLAGRVTSKKVSGRLGWGNIAEIANGGLVHDVTSGVWFADCCSSPKLAEMSAEIASPVLTQCHVAQRSIAAEI